MAESHILSPVNDAIAGAKEINILSIPGFLTAGRGDHTVFSGLGIPTLFFSCGLYEDYHQEEDTLENLDMDLLTASVDAIARTVAAVGNATELDATPIPLAGTELMLASGNAIFESILAFPKAFFVERDALESCRSLHLRTMAHLNESECDEAVHNDLVVQGILALVPILEGYENAIFAEDLAEGNNGDTGEDTEEMESGLAAFYFLGSLHESAFIEFYRQFAEKVVRRSRGSLITRGLPSHEYSNSQLREDEFALEEGEDGVYTLNVLVPTIHARIDHRTFARFRSKGQINVSCALIYAEGTKDELVDFLLLKWEKRGDGNDSNAIFTKLLGEITGEKIAPKLETWQSYRLTQLGMKTKQEWRWRIGRSANSHLQTHTLDYPYIYHEDMPTGVYRIASNPDISADIRAQAIAWYVHFDTETGTLSATPEMLTKLIAMLDDTSVITRNTIIESFDWEAIAIVGPLMREFFQQILISDAKETRQARTMSHFVHQRLQELTGVADLPPSRTVWETWLDNALAADPEGEYIPKRHKLSMPYGGPMELRLRRGKPLFIVSGQERPLPDSVPLSEHPHDRI